MKKLRIIIPLLTVVLTGCVGPGRPPHAFLPPIAEEYYVCEKCGSLHGGIYGKGPVASFSTSNASKCWHRWHEIPRADYQRQAAERFPAEWEKATSYVKRPERAKQSRAGTELRQQASTLSSNEKAELAADLLDGLPPILDDEDEGVAEAQKRHEEMDRDPKASITWEQLRREVGR